MLTCVTTTPEKSPPDIKVIGIRVQRKLHKKLKTLAATKETTIQELCIAAVEQFLEAQ